jgi:hypothetical protein
MIIPAGLTAFRIYVHTPGVFDAHLRLTDALTGVTSDVVIVPVDTPAAVTSCAQTTPTSSALWCSAAAIVVVIVRRHRRR